MRQIEREWALQCVGDREYASYNTREIERENMRTIIWERERIWALHWGRKRIWELQCDSEKRARATVCVWERENMSTTQREREYGSYNAIVREEIESYSVCVCEREISLWWWLWKFVRSEWKFGMWKWKVIHWNKNIFNTYRIDLHTLFISINY